MALSDMFNSAVNWYQDNPFVSQVAVPGGLSLYNQYQQGRANDQATGQLVGGYQQGLDALYNFYNTGRGDITAGRDMGLEQLGGMYGQSRQDLMYGRDQGLEALRGGLEQGAAAVSGAAGAGVSAAQNILGATRKDVSPYQAFGRQGLSQYQDLLADPNAITQSTDYQFRVGQGQQALERSAAASGMSLSGNTLAGLTQYGQEFGTRELDAALARRMGMIEQGARANELAGQVGSSVASTIGGLRSSEASSLGNLYRGFGSDMGNLYSSTGTNLANLARDYGVSTSNLYSEAGRGLAEMTGQFAEPVANTMSNIGAAQSIGTGAGADITSGGLRDIGNILDKVASGGSSGATFDPASGQVSGDITSGLSLPNIGTIPYADLLAAGGGTAAGAMEAAKLVASETAAGAGTWADLSAGPNQIAGMTGTSGAGGGMSSVTGFLSSAPGMGLVSGLLTGITTGDWGKAATTGVGTAAGAKLGSMVMPGIGTAVGATLGALFGGSIGPEPSNKSAGVALKLNSGDYDYADMGGDKRPSGAHKDFVDNVGKSTTEMTKVIKDVFPDMHFPEFSVEVGQRDGFKLMHGKGTQDFGQDIQGLSQGISDTIFTNMRRTSGGLSSWQKDAISRVNYADPSIAKQQLQLIKDNPNGLGGNVTSPGSTPISLATLAGGMR